MGHSAAPIAVALSRCVCFGNHNSGLRHPAASKSGHMVWTPLPLSSKRAALTMTRLWGFTCGILNFEHERTDVAHCYWVATTKATDDWVWQTPKRDKRPTRGQIYASPVLMACRKRIQSHGEAKAQDSPFVGVMVGVDSCSPFSVCQSGPSPWIKVDCQLFSHAQRRTSQAKFPVPIELA